MDISDPYVTHQTSWLMPYNYENVVSSETTDFRSVSKDNNEHRNYICFDPL